MIALNRTQLVSVAVFVPDECVLNGNCCVCVCWAGSAVDVTHASRASAQPSLAPAAEAALVDTADAFDPFPASFRKAKSIKKVAFSADDDDDVIIATAPKAASVVAVKSLKTAASADMTDLMSDDEDADAVKPQAKKNMPVQSLRASQAAKQRLREKLDNLAEGEAEYVAIMILRACVVLCAYVSNAYHSTYIQRLHCLNYMQI